MGWPNIASCRECSTPFGIRGICARRSQVLRKGFGVLNAFRHQRNLRTDKLIAVGKLTNVLNAFRHLRNLRQTTSILAETTY